jgi:hypothetical protein
MKRKDLPNDGKCIICGRSGKYAFPNLSNYISTYCGYHSGAAKASFYEIEDDDEPQCCYSIDGKERCKRRGSNLYQDEHFCLTHYKKKEKTMHDYTNALADEICAVCQDNLVNNDIVITVCGHHFHNDCLSKWVGEHERISCPTCRGELFIQDTSPSPKKTKIEIKRSVNIIDYRPN